MFQKVASLLVVIVHFDKLSYLSAYLFQDTDLYLVFLVCNLIILIQLVNDLQ